MPANPIGLLNDRFNGLNYIFEVVGPEHDATFTAKEEIQGKVCILTICLFHECTLIKRNDNVKRQRAENAEYY